jgi:hypothetical protein
MPAMSANETGIALSLGTAWSSLARVVERRVGANRWRAWFLRQQNKRLQVAQGMTVKEEVHAISICYINFLRVATF